MPKGLINLTSINVQKLHNQIVAPNGRCNIPHRYTHNEALKYYQKALEIRLQFVDENHTIVQKIKNNINLIKSKIAESQK